MNKGGELTLSNVKDYDGNQDRVVLVEGQTHT